MAEEKPETVLTSPRDGGLLADPLDETEVDLSSRNGRRGNAQSSTKMVSGASK